MESSRKYLACLRNSYKAFRKGDSDLAIKSLNITFNHATNTDWEPVDVQKILVFRAWLYFYERRFDRAAASFDQAIIHYQHCYVYEGKELAFLYYNLAECYARRKRRELSKVNFWKAIEIVRRFYGDDHQITKMVHRRYREIHNVGGLCGIVRGLGASYRR